jgi:hypothetical protein
MQAAIAQAQTLLPDGYVLNASWIYGPAPQPAVTAPAITGVTFILP